MRCHYCRGNHASADEIRACATARGAIRSPADNTPTVTDPAPPWAPPLPSPSEPKRIEAKPRRKGKRRKRGAPVTAYSAYDTVPAKQTGRTGGKGWTPGFEASPQSKIASSSGKEAAAPDVVEQIAKAVPKPSKPTPLHPRAGDGTQSLPTSKDAEILKRLGNINDHDG